jgi:hypothetical protein
MTRTIAILGLLTLAACRTTVYKDDGTVQPFGGKNTYAISLQYVNGFTGMRGTMDDYLWYANGKCTSLGMYMLPVHKDGSMFVFRCTSQPNNPSWRKDAGVSTVTVENK